ncbi:MAG: hypothetical protein HY603_00150 [Parcubacteria group bacterium]|nr:hypothetical protein [Parcubacteria group bacterium]
MPEGPEEQLEFLRREDIRTMAKDMARLREEEAKKERERILQLQGGNKKQQDQPAAAPIAVVKEHLQIPLAPASLAGGPPGINLPKPLSRAKKIFVRVAIVFLVLFIIVNIIALIYSFTPIRLWIQNY